MAGAFTMRLRFLLAAAIILCASSARADEAVFQQKCAACHSIGQGARVGPDLKDTTSKYDEAWLIRWIMAPDRMLAEKDPTATKLFEEYNRIPMPNLAVSEAEARSLLAYIATASQAAGGGAQAGTAATAQSSAFTSWLGSVQFVAFLLFLGITVAIVVVFWHVAASTADPVPQIDTKSGYALRAKLFAVTTLVIVVTLGATLPFTPYHRNDGVPDRLVYVAARQFAFTYSSEPITSDEDAARVPALASLELPLGSLVEFRVTSLDATHGFGIYDAEGGVLAQTQAMPGYVNRLQVRFEKPGHYNVLCLEYCGVAHHMMRTAFIVK